MPLTNSALATIILNHYSADTTKQLAAAIDEVCSPADTYGFASSGIYVFWNVTTLEILYIGLAVDLGLRFKQHNGLAGCPAESSKREQIEAHFAENEKLGYTVLVQSPMDQAICEGWEKAYPDELELIAEEFGYLDADEVRETINSPLVNGLRWMEGALIRDFAEEHCRRPAWNRNSGANIEYSARDLDRARTMLHAVVLLKTDYLVLTAHCSMVELAASATHVAFESFLHGARFSLRAGGPPLKEICEAMSDPSMWERIKAANYMAKLPRL